MQNEIRTQTSLLSKGLGLVLAIGLGILATACGGAGANGGNENGDNEDTTAPTAPSGLQGTSGDSVIDLTWGTVAANDLGGYNVYRDTGPIEDISGSDPLNESLIADTTGFRDTGAQNGTTYRYVVTAVDTAGNESDLSSEIEKTPFDEPPSRP